MSRWGHWGDPRMGRNAAASVGGWGLERGIQLAQPIMRQDANAQRKPARFTIGPNKRKNKQ